MTAALGGVDVAPSLIFTFYYRRFFLFCSQSSHWLMTRPRCKSKTPPVPDFIRGPSIHYHLRPSLQSSAQTTQLFFTRISIISLPINKSKKLVRTSVVLANCSGSCIWNGQGGLRRSRALKLELDGTTDLFLISVCNSRSRHSSAVRSNGSVAHGAGGVWARPSPISPASFSRFRSSILAQNTKRIITRSQSKQVLLRILLMVCLGTRFVAWTAVPRLVSCWRGGLTCKEIRYPRTDAFHRLSG
jgi:hypothetical protein